MKTKDIVAVSCLGIAIIYAVLAIFDKRDGQHHLTRSQVYLVGGMILHNTN